MSRYLDRILARFKRQEAKGIAKYGQILEDNPRGVIEALEYLAEELTDGLNYIEEAIEKLKKEEVNLAFKLLCKDISINCCPYDDDFLDITDAENCVKAEGERDCSKCWEEFYLSKVEEE